LTLARFVLEKTGGDSLGEVSDNLERFRARIARASAAGGTLDAGSGETGSGGDD
jgi:hypothetical protein